jgi:hypothetical protein
MKFNKGDHLQETGTKYHGIVVNHDFGTFHWNKEEAWYLLENDELELINHWVPESKLELHKQPLREQKLEQLGIK